MSKIVINTRYRKKLPFNQFNVSVIIIDLIRLHNNTKKCLNSNLVFTKLYFFQIRLYKLRYNVKILILINKKEMKIFNTAIFLKILF